MRDRTKLTLANGMVYAMDLSPDGKVLALGRAIYRKEDGETKTDVRLSLLDPETGKVLREVEHEGGGVVFSPDGKLLAASGREGLAVWQVDKLVDVEGSPRDE
jgi:glucose/arabinose dehydrogenase